MSSSQIATPPCSIALEDRQLNAAWWALLARFLLHGLVVSTWVSRLPTVQTTLGLSNAALGVCLLGTALGSMMAVSVAGWAITRVGSKRVATWSTIAFSLSLIPIAVAFSPAALFAALLLYGAAGAANDVSINAQAVAVENAMGKPTMSRFHALFSIGGIAGAAFGGLLAAHDITPEIHLAALGLVFAVISAVTAPLLLDAHDDARRGLRPRLLWSRIPRSLLLLVVIAFCMFLSEGAMGDWSGIYLKQALHSTAATAALGYAVFSVGMSVFRMLGDALTRLLGPVATVRNAALVAAAGLLLALNCRSIAGALCGFAVTGAGFSVIVPLVFGAAGRLRSIPSGAGVAMISASGYMGLFVGPPMIGFTAHAASLRYALFLIVALMLVTAGIARAALLPLPSPES